MTPLFNLGKQLVKPKHFTRSYWTQLTSTGSSIEECVQTSLDSLKNKTPNVCVALVSKSFSPKHYQTLANELKTKLAPSVLIGGVIDRVPEFDHGVSLLLGFDEKIVPFTIKDSDERLKTRNISVGRWGRVEDKERTRYQNDFIESGKWKDFGSIGTPVQPFQLPPGLEEKPSFVFAVSDNEPDQLLQTLDHHYPDVPKVGIIGASTPFVTGTPFTLFDFNGLYGGGMLGFASYATEKSAPKVTVVHSALEKLGVPVKITRCQGNVILDLEENGATGVLLRLIQSSSNYTKDEEFYLAVYPLGQDPDSEENAVVSRITSGDPSRGNMAIDTTADLQPGQVVRFLRKKNLEFKNVSSEPIEEGNTVLGVSGKDYTIDASPVKIPDVPNLLQNVFGGVSENGVIVGHENIPGEILEVPYSKITFKL